MTREPEVVVAVVDDHRLFGSALALALRSEGFHVFEPALTDLEDIRAQLAAARPRVVLLDLDLGVIGRGDDLVEAATSGGMAVLVVSATRDPVRIGRCLHLGAAGWLSKGAPLDELVATIRSAAAGNVIMTTTEREQLVDAWRRRAAGAEAALARLTRREAMVLGQLMEGRLVEQIAAAAFVSEDTVRSQVKSILTKLGAHNQLQAVVIASHANWRPPPTERGDA